MYIRTHSKHYPGLKKEIIWQMWTDVNHWTDWHGDLDYCKMDLPFQVGHHFILKPKGVKPFKIVLTEIDEGRSFTDCTHFFGANMYDTHVLEETADGLLLSSKLVVTGLLAPLWVKLVARHVADSVPEEMDALVKLAREKHA
jgi:hypothetical protein